MPHGSGISIDPGCHVSSATYEQIPAWHQNFTSAELLSAFMPPASFPQIKVSGETSTLETIAQDNSAIYCHSYDDDVAGHGRSEHVQFDDKSAIRSHVALPTSAGPVSQQK